MRPRPLARRVVPRVWPRPDGVLEGPQLLSSMEHVSPVDLSYAVSFLMQYEPASLSDPRSGTLSRSWLH